MGIDATIYAKGQFTQEEIEKASTFMFAHMKDMTWRIDENDPYWKNHSIFTQEDYGLHFDTCSRYYGPGYERGNWPAIFQAIMAMKTLFPNSTIHYGTDGQQPERIPECDDQIISELWNHYQGPHGNDYRSKINNKTGKLLRFFK